MTRIWDFWKNYQSGGTDTDAANLNAREQAVYTAAVQDARPMLYATGNNGELVTELPVPVDTENTDKRVIFSVEIPDLAIGDFLIVMSEFELTNPHDYNIVATSQLIYGDTADSVIGTELTEANAAFNITPDMHHGTVPRHGMDTVTNPARKFINMVAWSGASQADPGDTCIVEQDYGRLQVLRYAALS